MHQALLLEEIRLPIFNQILENHTLYALARTCQAFGETALDVLWSDLDCFPRLIQCMPKDLWNISELDQAGRSLTLRRPISPSDWAILQKYSRRVRSVRGPSQHTFHGRIRRNLRIDDALLLALCAPSAPIPLLPNLKSLTWRAISDVHLSTLCRLVPSSLISLRLSIGPHFPWQESLDLTSAIRRFPFNQVFPSVKFLTVFPGGPSSSHLRGLQPSIGQLQNLVTIRWNDLLSDTIISLSQLPTLTEATFKIPSDFSNYIEALAPRSSKRKLGFSNLRKLHISHHAFAPLLSFLGYFAFDLETISVNCGPNRSPGRVEDLFISLASSLSRSIRSIQIVEEFRTTLEPPLSIHGLRPLLQFKELQYLHIDIQFRHITLTDAELVEMADAWPNLTTLLLEGDPEARSHVTPYGLVALLGRCPKLDVLNIQVNFSAVDRVDFDPSSFPSLFDLRNRQELRSLQFGAYAIVYPHAIAKFLACFVPKNTSVGMHWKRENESPTFGSAVYKKMWDETSQIFDRIRST